MPSSSEYQRQWRRENRARVRATHNAWRRDSKLKVIAAYGGACTCCGETEPVFLTVDHVDGRPVDHKLTRGAGQMSGINLYRTVIREGFPACYTILCFNCNSGRALNGGVCPHQQMVEAGADDSSSRTAPATKA